MRQTTVEGDLAGEFAHELIFGSGLGQLYLGQRSM